ncbi:MAG: HEPN family nuclease [Thermodesulfovibrionia bacterium]|nr:HEPN family nuclease [Thermodesulfovibrionia bacterium]
MDKVKDFSTRTKANLKLIREEADKVKEGGEGKEAYEVTQLINSMLGLFVFPQQEFYNKIPKTPIKELEQAGWQIPKVDGNYPQAKDLKELARYLRNGISHFNLDFTSSGGHVNGLIIWNKDNGRIGKITWKATLTIKELEDIVSKFTDLLIK